MADAGKRDLDATIRDIVDAGSSGGAPGAPSPVAPAAPAGRTINEGTDFDAARAALAAANPQGSPDVLASVGGVLPGTAAPNTLNLSAVPGMPNATPAQVQTAAKPVADMRPGVAPGVAAGAGMPGDQVIDTDKPSVTPAGEGLAMALPRQQKFVDIQTGREANIAAQEAAEGRVGETKAQREEAIANAVGNVRTAKEAEAAALQQNADARIQQFNAEQARMELLNQAAAKLGITDYKPKNVGAGILDVLGGLFSFGNGHNVVMEHHIAEQKAREEDAQKRQATYNAAAMQALRDRYAATGDFGDAMKVAHQKGTEAAMLGVDQASKQSDILRALASQNQTQIAAHGLEQQQAFQEQMAKLNPYHQASSNAMTLPEQRKAVLALMDRGVSLARAIGSVTGIAHSAPGIFNPENAVPVKGAAGAQNAAMKNKEALDAQAFAHDELERQVKEASDKGGTAGMFYGVPALGTGQQTSDVTAAERAIDLARASLVRVAMASGESSRVAQSNAERIFPTDRKWTPEQLAIAHTAAKHLYPRGFVKSAESPTKETETEESTGK
jgi:hypothetical protein